jgi:superfamily I DNA and/or RNA helicase
MKTNYKQLSVGIIAPYQHQVQYIKQLISERYDKKLYFKIKYQNLTFFFSKLEKVEVGTVDSFQGREKDIILFSSVRANNSNSIGY